MKFERLLETYLLFAPKGNTSFWQVMRVLLKEKLFSKEVLKKVLHSILERHRKVSSLSSFSLSTMRHMRVQPFLFRREGREIMPEQTRIALDGEGSRWRLHVGLRRNAMHAWFPLVGHALLNRRALVGLP